MPAVWPSCNKRLLAAVWRMELSRKCFGTACVLSMRWRLHMPVSWRLLRWGPSSQEETCLPDFDWNALQHKTEAVLYLELQR